MAIFREFAWLNNYIALSSISLPPNIILLLLAYNLTDMENILKIPPNKI